MSQINNVTITLDGMEVQATQGEPVLTVARRNNVTIPTLCHLDGLKPYASCRLCIVSARNGTWQKFVTACNYPVFDGLAIEIDVMIARA